MKTVRQRFDEKWVADPVTGCHLWTACHTGGGYGNIKVNGERWPAHRLAWVLEVGAIPSGMMVLHRCDVPACVNVAHLFLGTHLDNMADRSRKERNHSQRLKAADVRLIRSSKLRNCDLAELFAVSRVTISRVRRGLQWIHLKETP